MQQAPWRQALWRFAPPVLWMAVILGFSTTLFAAAQTAQLVMPVLHSLLPGADAATLGLIHHYLRKAMHLAVFGVLVLLWYRALGGPARGRPARLVASLALALACASADELHQAFVSGRTGTVKDVGWDGLGATLALIARRTLWRS
ncbi:MAG: VanZ family protein [Candidatus Methylomirabilales bacterium]